MAKVDTTELDTSRQLSIAEYLQQRVDNQLSWYSRKSAYNKRWYYRLQFITLLSAVAVPVITLTSGDFKVRIVVALLGAIAALAAGLLSMHQFRDQWLDYRSTAEALKFEKYLFLTRSAPYDKSTAFSLFVQRVEATILSENRSWQQKAFNLPQEEPEDASSTQIASTSMTDTSVREGL
ncbi:MAG: DUF4231 domain-containing protein [Granulosicoccus sp.]